ncbi:hypothetical protein OWR29_27265 [Actinoplanes sp. Pm04-4]|uniref:Uncharacterized protein n=1 Tax=Paractinoplanes pyxinae TaxID=2997416 RepID=A0ABT4B5D9_9ACTN|nr:hypothetical protein [Actinoplanes pyxinae]MCY1141714.1 hypothetical protein [Actinoplanes pyxinae]
MADLRQRAADLPAGLPAAERFRRLGLVPPFEPDVFVAVQPDPYVTSVAPTPVHPAVAAASEELDAARAAFDAANNAWLEARAYREALEQQGDETFGGRVFAPDYIVGEPNPDVDRHRKIVRTAKKAEDEAWQARGEAAKRAEQASSFHTGLAAAVAIDQSAATLAADQAAQDHRLRAAGIHPDNEGEPERRPRRPLIAFGRSRMPRG